MLLACPHGMPMLPARPCQRNAQQARRRVRTGATRSHYEQLGVAEDASAEDVKRAFRRAARTLHPDVNPDPEATLKFMAVLAAYQALSDTSSRSAYDSQMGMSSARAKDPRFVRFERWRREVVPMLEVYLEEWSEEVEQIVQGWVATLSASDAACRDALAEAHTVLQQCLASTTPQPQQPRTNTSGGVAKQTLQPVLEATGPHQAMQQSLQQVAAALQQLEAGVAGGSPRMGQYVEKRFEQVSQMFPAYPELVWEKEWYDAADAWLDRMEAELQPWKLKLQVRTSEVQQLRARLQPLRT